MPATDTMQLAPIYGVLMLDKSPLCTGGLHFDLNQKNDRNDFEMIFRELSNPTFRFSLRRPGAEMGGGGRSNAPPPPLQQAVENPEAQQGAG